MAKVITWISFGFLKELIEFWAVYGILQEFAKLRAGLLLRVLVKGALLASCVVTFSDAWNDDQSVTGKELLDSTPFHNFLLCAGIFVVPKVLQVLSYGVLCFAAVFYVRTQWRIRDAGASAMAPVSEYGVPLHLRRAVQMAHRPLVAVEWNLGALLAFPHLRRDLHLHSVRALGFLYSMGVDGVGWGSTSDRMQVGVLQVAKDVHEVERYSFVFDFFWLSLLSGKFVLSYYMQVRLVHPPPCIPKT